MEVKINQFFFNRELLIRVIIYSIPTILFFFSSFFLPEISWYKLKISIIESAFFSVILFIIIELVPSGKIKKIFYLIGYFFISMAVFFQISYYHLYSGRISESTIFILLETNATESYEFLKSYLETFNIIILAFLAAPLLILFFFPTSKGLNLSRKSFRKRGYLLILFIFLFTYSLKSLANHNFYWIVSNSYIGYLKEMELFDEYGLDQPIGGTYEVKVKSTEKRKIFVVIIGESTTRHRMSLYGYDRHTNPELDKIKEELLIYQNVISPHSHSIPSLKKALTFNHYENTNRLNEGSVVQLMNSAGFETHWISNQKPLGVHETFVSRIAQASQYIEFLNVNYKFPPEDYDEIVLKSLAKVLPRKKDLFVVIHLMGTHGEYAYRFPASYNHFSGKSSSLSDIKGLKRYNSYDNAILYNDFIVSEIISLVKKQEEFSYVLYFSDHGEDVYQINKSAGHTESEGTYPMYDVPFILWQSKSFKENIRIIFEPHRPYMLDDLIYSISDLSGLKYRSFQSQRSIFSEHFQERDRIIYEGKNYDSIFKQ